MLKHFCRIKHEYNDDDDSNINCSKTLTINSMLICGVVAIISLAVCLLISLPSLLVAP